MIRVSERSHSEGGYEQWYEFEGKRGRFLTKEKWDEMTDNDRDFYESQMAEWFRVACHSDKGRIKGD